MNSQPIFREIAAILNTCTKHVLSLWAQNKNFQCEVRHLYYWKFYLIRCLPGCYLALYIDNNDNKMIFLGNIVYLRPCSVIYGSCASCSRRQWLYAAQINNIPEKSHLFPYFQTQNFDIYIILRSDTTGRRRWLTSIKLNFSSTIFALESAWDH